MTELLLADFKNAIYRYNGSDYTAADFIDTPAAVSAGVGLLRTTDYPDPIYAIGPLFDVFNLTSATVVFRGTYSPSTFSSAASDFDIFYWSACQNDGFTQGVEFFVTVGRTNHTGTRRYGPARDYVAGSMRAEAFKFITTDTPEDYSDQLLCGADFYPDSIEDGRFDVAFTFSVSKLSSSLNGAAYDSVSNTNDKGTTAQALTAGTGWQLASSVIESITIYDERPDSELEILSSPLGAPPDPDPDPSPTVINDYTISGFSWSQGTAKQILEPLLTVFDVDARPHDFGIEFLPRGSASGGTIPSGKMVRSGDDALYTMTMTAETDLPRRVFLTFADIDADHQPNTAVAQRPADAVDSAREMSIDMTNMVMDIGRGRQFTERFLRREWFGRGKVETNLPPAYLAMEPGDVETLTLDGVSVDACLRKMTIRANGVIETIWRRDNPVLNQLSGNGGATTGGRTPDVLALAGETQGWVLDVPLFADVQDTPVPFVYLAAAPVNETSAWYGADFLQNDIPDEATFSAGWDSIAYDQAAIWGTATEALPDVNPATIDYGTILTVEISYGSLESVTLDQLLTNPTMNLALIGDEIVQFQDAILESAGTYTLSGFHRGMRGTERHIDGHTSGERFILLTSALKQHALGASEIGDTDYYIPMSSGESTPDYYAMIALPFLGVAHRPYAPAHVTMERDSGSGDWSFAWVRRTRLGGSNVNGQNVPLGETSESYAVKIMDGATVVRRIEVDDPEATYTNAQQVADWGGAQTSLTIQVIQINPLLGLDGFATTAISGAPDWVFALRSPAGDLPLMVADFKNGRYYVDGQAVTEPDLFEENRDWGYYTSGQVVPGGGLTDLSTNTTTPNPSDGHFGAWPVLKAEVAAMIGDECTVVLATNFLNGTLQLAGFEYNDLPGFGTERFVWFRHAATGSSYVSTYESGVQDTFFYTGDGMTGRNKIAATLGMTHLAGSTNGEAVQTASPTTPVNAWTNICIVSPGGVSGQPGFLEMIIVYPVQDDADLPSLSTL